MPIPPRSSWVTDRELVAGVEPISAPYEGAVLPLAPHQRRFHLRLGIEPNLPGLQPGVRPLHLPRGLLAGADTGNRTRDSSVPRTCDATCTMSAWESWVGLGPTCTEVAAPPLTIGVPRRKVQPGILRRPASSIDRCLINMSTRFCIASRALTPRCVSTVPVSLLSSRSE